MVLHDPEIDQILADESAGGQVLWALADNQGTVRDLVDSTGTGCVAKTSEGQKTPDVRS